MNEPLARWLADLRIRHTILAVGEIGAAAAVRIEPEGAAAFHYCLRGSCVVEPEGHAAIQLHDGELLFMREGLARVVWSGAGRRPRPAPLASLIPPVQRDAAVTFSHGAGAAERIVLGGGFCVDSPEARLFIEALPPLFCVRRGAPYAARLRIVVGELVDEATADLPGAGPIVARLAEVAVLLGVRSFVASGGLGSPLVEAARDPRLARALASIHREPERPWTIARLARVAGMSRSGFAAAFAGGVGEPPASYLARVRMARAERLLLEGEGPLPRVAEAVGYSSAAAFSVAFKRLRGASPGSLNRPAGTSSGQGSSSSLRSGRARSTALSRISGHRPAAATRPTTPAPAWPPR